MASGTALARYFTSLSALTLCLVVLGAVVRAKGAGMACPDWPLCFGQLVPSMDFGVIFEWGHRALAGGVGLGLVLGAVLTLGDKQRRADLGGLFLFSFVVLGIQVVLGGLTVLQLLASWSVTAHLITGNLFAITLTAIAARLYERVSPVERTPVPPWLMLNALSCALVLLVQFTLGGLVSSNFAGLACTEWPSCLGGQMAPTWLGPVGLHVLHRVTAYTLVLVLFSLAMVSRGYGRSGRLAALALGLALAQVVFGVANVLLRLPVEVTALHSAGAAALAQTLYLLLRELHLSPNQAPQSLPPVETA